MICFQRQYKLIAGLLRLARNDDYDMNIINKVALAIFKDKKMLQVRSKKHPEVFFTLGGKPEAGESEIEALKREVKEEIDCEIEEGSLKFLTELILNVGYIGKLEYFQYL